MKIVKFLVFVFILIVIVFIANITKIKNTEKTYNNETVFNASNIIVYDGNELKTIASINLSTSWQTLSKIFETESSNLRGQILKKTINILDTPSELTVFIDDNKINQITISIEGIDKKDILKTFPEAVIEKSKVINTPEEIYKVENAEGNIIAKITEYKANKYILSFTETESEEGKVFIIELSNPSKY